MEADQNAINIKKEGGREKLWFFSMRIIMIIFHVQEGAGTKDDLCASVIKTTDLYEPNKAFDVTTILESFTWMFFWNVTSHRQASICERLD